VPAGILGVSLAVVSDAKAFAAEGRARLASVFGGLERPQRLVADRDRHDRAAQLVRQKARARVPLRPAELPGELLLAPQCQFRQLPPTRNHRSPPRREETRARPMLGAHPTPGNYESYFQTTFVVFRSRAAA